MPTGRSGGRSAYPSGPPLSGWSGRGQWHYTPQDFVDEVLGKRGSILLSAPRVLPAQRQLVCPAPLAKGLGRDSHKKIRSSPTIFGHFFFKFGVFLETYLGRGFLGLFRVFAFFGRVGRIFLLTRTPKKKKREKYYFFWLGDEFVIFEECLI